MIRRVCSYSITIKTPEAPTTYSDIVVTFAQNGETVVEKEKSDMTISDNTVTVNLDQTETALFTAGILAVIQCRCYASQYNAPGSRIWKVEVQPALNEDVLP